MTEQQNQMKTLFSVAAIAFVLLLLAILSIMIWGNNNTVEKDIEELLETEMKTLGSISS